MKRVLFLLCGLCLLGPLYGQSVVTDTLGIDFAWYPPNHAGYETTGFAPIDFSTVSKDDLSTVDDGRDLGKSGFEGIVKYTRSIRTPFMQGDGALTSGNNLDVRLFGDLSPVSIGAGVKTILTPIALMNFDASVYAGSGWSVGALNGLALNTEEDPFDPTPFGGLFFESIIGTTIQFDLAAVVPGDWNHIVAVYRPFLRYRLNTGADSDEAWQWQVDKGENFNGWCWKQNVVLGYQTPALETLNTLGVLLETEERITKWNESRMKDGGWGSDFMQIYVALITVLDFTEDQSLTIQAQFANGRDYTDATVGNESFYNREVDTDDPRYWFFRRIALSYSLTL